MILARIVGSAIIAREKRVTRNHKIFLGYWMPGFAGHDTLPPRQRQGRDFDSIVAGMNAACCAFAGCLTRSTRSALAMAPANAYCGSVKPPSPRLFNACSWRTCRKVMQFLPVSATF
jgi:hypothetical protein